VYDHTRELISAPGMTPEEIDRYVLYLVVL
jgi:hypothetical protein